MLPNRHYFCILLNTSLLFLYNYLLGSRAEKMRTLNGWQRLFVVISLLWTVIVVGYSISLWPKMTKHELFAEWARERVEAMRTYSSEGLSHAEFRARVFGEKTDEEIAQPNGFDLATARTVGENIGAEMMRAAEVEVIDQKYGPLVLQAPTASRSVFLLSAAALWVAPLLALALLGMAAAWVRDGFRRATP